MTELSFMPSPSLSLSLLSSHCHSPPCLIA
uniref:Uncharacterized protein n=1 Tax=Anguilla anguilla TaxID=7936 RepID=A0A0E9R2R8_ANGAN